MTNLDKEIMEGAYYSKEMALVRNQGQITTVSYDSSHPVNTYWDIGQGSDQMSIIFYQKINNRHNIINYHESSNEGWAFYANLFKCQESWNSSAYEDSEVNCAFMGFQAAWQRQQTTIDALTEKLAKAAEALKFTQDKLLCDETYNSRTIKEKISDTLAEITKGDREYDTALQR